MNDPAPSTLAEALTKWAGKRRPNESAKALVVHWQTATDWLSGKTVPRERDLPHIAICTGIELPELQRLAAADRKAKHPGPRIDTVGQTQAWIERQDPTPTAQGA